MNRGDVVLVRPSERTSLLRIVIGIHLAAVCICAACSYLDHLARPFGPVLGVAFGASYLAWPVFPIVVLVAAFRRGFSRPAVCALVAEAALCVGQAFVLVPMAS